MDLLGGSICPYCGVGCRLEFEGAGKQLSRVRGDTRAAANLGRMCAKGAQLGPTIDTSDRLTHPLLRRSKSGPLERVSWEEAIAHMAARLGDIHARSGPDALGFYGSGQLDTETCYLITKLFKGHLGCNNTDSNSRLCMAAAVAGYKTSLGSDGPPTCYEDIELADVFLIIGSNMAEAHPVLFDRVRDARRARPDVKVIVVDPRRTPTAAIADVHLPVSPGGDIPLLNALARLLLLMGAVDERFTQEHTR
ncbi:MAG: molybdopterin-dependent oxidoreductase, partial [Gemmataceae bacterium]